ncbi:MAG: nucleotidyltransferase family protein, partial [Desulfobacterales bacterium]
MLLKRPFKGPALAITAYRDLAARQFADLDILINRADLATVCDILKELGYRMDINLGPNQLSIFSTHEDNLSFYNEDGVTIEMHWELSGLYLTNSVSMHDLKQTLTTIRLSEREVTHLSAASQLVYLCVHGAKHMWERIEWLSCIHELA